MLKITTIVMLSMIAFQQAFPAVPADWKQEWPQTDFDRATVPLTEIISGGPPRDGIPAIDTPQFASLNEANDIDESEPVIGLTVNGEAKAYPLRIMIWHEIVNDRIGGIPVTVTYCPLCNTSIVFDRRLGNRTLDFGTTGKLRHSDLVMYDRQTQSWWQQYAGEAIAGEMAGQTLRILPSRLESFAEFKRRNPDGRVLVPANNSRQYGQNPYAGYDQSSTPFLYRGKLPDDVPAMMRVVAIDNLAFTLPLVREASPLVYGDLEISWSSGQRSALDTRQINQGRDVGNVVVRRNGEDVPYVVTFAFAFYAFNPDGILLKDASELYTGFAAKAAPTE